MSITLQLATPDSLGEIVEAVAVWQHDGGPVQLHPGDLGWHWRLGAQELAEALRVWRRDGQILAVGLVDGVGLIRMPSHRGSTRTTHSPSGYSQTKRHVGLIQKVSLHSS